MQAAPPRSFGSEILFLLCGLELLDMATIAHGEKIRGDRLATLTAASAASSEVVVRTVSVIDYEIEGKKGKFTVVAVMIMDAAGDMVHMTENIFGTEIVRQGVVQQRKKFWCPEGKPSLFFLKNIKKLERQKMIHLSCSIPSSIVIEHFNTPKSTIKAVPVMQGSMEDKVLPGYYLPTRLALGDLKDVEDGMFVTICGLLLEDSGPETTAKGMVRNISITDGVLLLEGVKIWHENGEGDLGSKLHIKECMVVLSNYWVGVDPKSGKVAKLVNVPYRSRIRALTRSELCGPDLQYYDKVKSASPGETLDLSQEGSYEPKERKTMEAWALDSAEQSSAVGLSLLLKVLPDEEVGHALHRLDGVFPQLDPSPDYRTKKGDIFAKLTLSDSSGTIQVRCPGEPLCLLAGLPPNGITALGVLLEGGHVMLRRASVYVQRAVQTDRDDPDKTYVSLVVKAVQVDWFLKEGLPKHLLTHSSCLRPCTLGQLKKPSFGGMKVDGIAARMPLALLKGGAFPPRTKIDDDKACSVVNAGCICIGGVEADTTEVEVVAKVPLPVQTQYVLDAGQPCMVVIGGAEFNEAGKVKVLHVIAVWKGSQMNMTLLEMVAAFQKEMACVQEQQRKYGKKRTAADARVEIASAPKRRCATLSGEYAAAGEPSGAHGGA